MSTGRRAWTTALFTVAALTAVLGVTPHRAPVVEPQDELTVRVDTGQVRGARSGAHRVFFGIPYAGPPTGVHRWAAPRPAGHWSGVRDTSRPGPLCPQVPSAYADISSLEEDCLVLNVTAPPKGRGGPRPVLVWIHGDGSVGGGEFFGARGLADRGSSW